MTSLISIPLTISEGGSSWLSFNYFSTSALTPSNTFLILSCLTVPMIPCPSLNYSMSLVAVPRMAMASLTILMEQLVRS